MRFETLKDVIEGSRTLIGKNFESGTAAVVCRQLLDDVGMVIKIIVEGPNNRW
jgi:hypothetical protein